MRKKKSHVLLLLLMDRFFQFSHFEEGGQRCQLETMNREDRDATAVPHFTNAKEERKRKRERRKIVICVCAVLVRSDW